MPWFNRHNNLPMQALYSNHHCYSQLEKQHKQRHVLQHYLNQQIVHHQRIHTTPWQNIDHRIDITHPNCTTMYTVTQIVCAKVRMFVRTQEDSHLNQTNQNISHSYRIHNDPTLLYLLNLYNPINNHKLTIYYNKCYYQIPTNQRYPSNQPYTLVFIQPKAYKRICHHN